MTRLWTIAVSPALACLAVSAAADTPAANKAAKSVTVEPVGLTVAVPRPGSAGRRAIASGLRPGTDVSFRMTRKDMAFVALDYAASRLKVFADNKGTQLAASTDKGFLGGWLSRWPRISTDARACVFSIHGNTVPAKGASALIVQARVVAVCGADPKPVERPVAMKIGATFKLASVLLTVSNLRVSETSKGQRLVVTLSSKQPMYPIRSLRFFQPRGKEIEALRTTPSWSNETWTMTVQLAKVVRQTTIKADCYTRMETVTVPIDAKITLGL